MFACLEKGDRAKRAEGGGRDDSGRDDGGVQNQEGAEREEPGLRAEARWGGGGGAGEAAETQPEKHPVRYPGSLVLSPFHRTRK